MALPRTDLIVRDSLYQTGNIAYTATSGIRKAEVIRYVNEAQTTILNKILGCHSSLFTDKVIVNTTATAEYLIPTSVHSTGNISSVFYSFDGTDQNYVPLELRSPRAEVSIASFPSCYFIRNGSVVLSPIPAQTGGKLKLNFQYNLPSLDIRRALVTTATTNSITLTLNNTLLQETIDDLTNGFVDYVSVVDKDGTQLATGLPVTSYTSATRVIASTLTAAQVTAVTAGTAYLVFGTNATTHSQLIPICERFVTHYTATLIQMRDSNSEASLTSDLMKGFEQEILDSVSVLEEDITAIAVLDTNYLNYADSL
jgi:hypothetical protein